MERLTIDVEDYFSLVARDKLGVEVSVSNRLDGEMSRLLDLLDELGARATCFVVGKVAKERPHIVKEIGARGHEIASHSFEHRLMQGHSPGSFQRDLRQSIRILEDVGSVPIRGYRAPAFSLTGKQRWAFAIMAEEGIQYDSSVRLVWPGGRIRAQALIEAAADSGILEIPGLAIGWGRVRAPLAGGGGLRHLPVALTRRAMDLVRRDGFFIPLYIHPYDLTVSGPVPAWPAATLAKRLRFKFFDWTQRRGRSKVAPQLHELVPGKRLGNDNADLEAASRPNSESD